MQRGAALVHTGHQHTRSLSLARLTFLLDPAQIQSDPAAHVANRCTLAAGGSCLLTSPPCRSRCFETREEVDRRSIGRCCLRPIFLWHQPGTRQRPLAIAPSLARSLLLATSPSRPWALYGVKYPSYSRIPIHLPACPTPDLIPNVPTLPRRAS